MHDVDIAKREKQYKDDVEAQMRFFVQKDLLGQIRNFQTVSNWINQFPPESLTPYFLLDTLIIVTQQQAKASLKNILDQIQASIFKDNPTLSDEELFSLYEEHLKHSAFVCACLPGRTASGAPQIMRELRQILGKNFREAAVSNLCGIIHKHQIKHVYIVDDLIGTGETITTQLGTKEWCSSCPYKAPPVECSLESIADCHPNVDFTVIAVVMHTQGKERIKGRFHPCAAYTVSEAYDLLSESCVLYRDEQYRKAIIDDVKKIMDEHKMWDNRYALHLPIGICDDFPNNALELFWWPHSPQWYPLLPRIH